VGSIPAVHGAAHFFFLVPKLGKRALPSLYCPSQEWFHGAVPNESLAERLNGKLHRLFVGLFIVWVFLLGFRPMMDNVDLGWHVAQGRWMVQHGSFYRQDVLNYPNLGHAVVDEYPLFQIVLYAAWSLGWWGPCLLTALTYALLACHFFGAARTFDLEASSILCLAVGLMFIYLQLVFPLRPHMVTYLCIAALGIFLLRHRDATNWTIFWPMALLQAAWVNCHSGFVVGPAMVGLFGAEMVARKWIGARAFPLGAVRTWLGALLLVALACFVNPYGWARFYLPFYQDQLESIRAYVGEMEPLSGGLDSIFAGVTLAAVVVMAAGVLVRKGGTAYSFLLLALFFYFQAQSVQKAWPVFGVFLPLLILGSGAFSATILPPRLEAWLNVTGHFFVAVVAGMALILVLNGALKTSLPSQWREYDHGRSELSLDAAAWMKAHGVDGRLFHRCEDGGWLQEEGFDHGETFSDTGFGKYDEAFIHEVGLVNERPALVPHFLAAYRPDFVVCSTFCYQWPYYLKRNGWRLIYYSPNSSVWTRPELRPDLPTVRDEEVMAAFDHDLAANGLPADVRLFGRNLIALNSLGLEDFAFAKLTGLPKELHHAPWYWEAARIICFEEPRLSSSRLNDVINLENEAGALHDNAVTAEFRAYFRYDAMGDSDGALRELENIPPHLLGNNAAELLLKIELDRKLPEALALARRTDCFDLRNGRHWQYLAQAEEQAGHLDAARIAWQKAVFYYPDDPVIMAAATAFAAKNNDPALEQAIADSGKVYGVTR
jgi:tetratricopeptide (TPR) repeat protein